MSSEFEAFLAKGREAYQKADYVAAERSLTEALQRGASGYADVHHQLGVIYHSWGLLPKARAEFEEALRINPHYTEAALNLSITYNDLGRYSESRELLARFAPSGDEQPGQDLTRAKIANLHAEVGDAYRSASMQRDAVLEYRRALGLCPHFVDIRNRLAQTLAELGERDEAIGELRVATADRPSYLPARLQLSLLLYGKGDKEGAVKELQKVLEIQPTNERAQQYMRMLEPERNHA
ncbi:MAG: tetratricopeptide repeat protein [Deltaproteobacteria bacterium]|nr:tetratricopeptide repeat protein [Deltaproteobacteria bacterium]